MPKNARPADPVFNSFRRKPHRPFYSVREVWCGGVVVLLLAGVATWITWRGAHPEPGLFQLDDSLLAEKAAPVPVYEHPLERWQEPASAAIQAPAGTGANTSIFPAAILDSDWKAAAPVAEFDASNLYEKIDGREGFYKALGFERLHFVSLVANANPDLTIDIELFDMGAFENALGALTGEITGPDAKVETGADGFFHASVNSAFLARGRFYARMIGSDDSEVIRTKIRALRTALEAGLPAEPLPWAYALFAGRLGLNPAAIQFLKTDAFSVAGATDFYACKVGPDLEVFVSRRASEGEAAALATKFEESFRAFGKPVPPGPDVPPDCVVVKNEFVGRFDAVTTAGPFVFGARLAPTLADVVGWISRLRAGLGGLAEPPGEAGR